MTVVFVPGAKHPITQVAQSMLDLCDAKLKEVSVHGNICLLSHPYAFLFYLNAMHVYRRRTGW